MKRFILYCLTIATFYIAANVLANSLCKVVKVFLQASHTTMTTTGNV
jgi:hypothetical protein